MSYGSYKALVKSLVLRHIKVKYQRSVLGFLWTLLNPLIMAIVLITVFSYILIIPIENFWAFLISGFFVWNFLSSALFAAAYTLPEHAPLTRSIAFPSGALILSVALAKFIEFAAAMVPVLLILVFFLHGSVPESFMLLPVLALLLLLLALGLQLPIATLGVFYKDVEHGLPLVLMILFYLSPVFYPVELIPEAARPYYMMNPIAQVLVLYQEVLYVGRFPPEELLWTATIEVLLILACGHLIFRRYKPVFAEVV